MSAGSSEMRDQDGDGDGDRGRDAHLGQDRDAHHGETGEGDDDGEAREDDGAAGRADGAPDGLERVEVGVVGELGAEAGQDEQRVVDGHREPDHDRQDRRTWR